MRTLKRVTRFVQRAYSWLDELTVTRPVDIPPEELLYPHRFDVMLRIDFLRAFDEHGMKGAAERPYMRFIQGQARGVKCPPPAVMARRFVNTYESIKAKGFSKADRLPVVDRLHPHFAFLPPDHQKGTALVTGRYDLIDGAHRLAIMAHLGWTNIPCKIVRAPYFTPPDYTTFIDRSGLQCSWQELPGKGPWPRTPLALQQVQDELWQILLRDRQQFGRGQFYQSCAELGLPGQRPTEQRFAEYHLGEVLRQTDHVLDIGSNCGFFSMMVARHVASVDGVEVNPLLVEIARKAQQYLRQDNCRFHHTDFNGFVHQQLYDVILSFAVHHWVGMPFADYIRRLHNMLREGGRLVLESHELDRVDRDWEAKIAMVHDQGFDVVRDGTICDDWIIQRRYLVVQKRRPTGDV